MLVLLPRAQRSLRAALCAWRKHLNGSQDGSWSLVSGGINASQWHERNIKEVDVKQPVAVAGSTRR